jgi:DNA-binding transcriptional ArsR family regulator
VTSSAAGESGPVAVRYVADVATLRVLSDPLRLAIVNALMRGGQPGPPRTAKELADELGEPQTKLYRHLKQLLSADLIQVADTRVVSGILEHRYRAGQLSLRIEESFLGGGAPVDDAMTTLRSVFDDARDELFKAIRNGAVRLGEPEVPAGTVRPTVAALQATIPLPRAQDFAARLGALVKEFSNLESDRDGATVRMLVMYYQAPAADSLT